MCRYEYKFLVITFNFQSKCKCRPKLLSSTRTNRKYDIAIHQTRKSLGIHRVLTPSDFGPRVQAYLNTSEFYTSVQNCSEKSNRVTQIVDAKGYSCY